jgi:hypothetical protein
MKILIGVLLAVCSQVAFAQKPTICATVVPTNGQGMVVGVRIYAEADNSFTAVLNDVVFEHGELTSFAQNPLATVTVANGRIGCGHLEDYAASLDDAGDYSFLLTADALTFAETSPDVLGYLTVNSQGVALDSATVAIPAEDQAGFCDQ